jgi:hypothetical protein
VVDSRKRKILLLCEIEEEGANPKKIVGDCVNVFLSDSVCIAGKPYEVEGSHLVVGIAVEGKGTAADKARKLEPRIQACIRKEAQKGIRLELITESDPQALIDKLESHICGLVGIRD